ncbi:MAG: DUF1232 domain-containing protein [Halanaerobiaceae bacterium]|jgi:uncharacterized membrane protein YkvA (DUF1232 family)|nr:DUF1232 domain-containing protein [Halanaerobiaceae bacterium]
MSGISSIFLKIIRYLFAKDVNIGEKLLFLLPAIYLLFPFDIIPDLIPFSGHLDDIAVLLFMWPLVKSLLNRYYNGTGYDGGNKKKEKDTIDIGQDDYEIN